MRKWQILLNIFLEIFTFVAGCVLAIYFIPKLLGFFWPFVASAILSVLATPLCAFLEKHIKLNKKWSSALIMIFVLVGLAVGGYWGVAKLAKETLTLLSEAPNYYKQLIKLINTLIAFVNSRVSVVSPNIGQQIESMLNDLITQAGTVLNDLAPRGVEVLGSVASNVTNGLIGFFVMILSAYFFIADKERISEEVAKFVPPSIYDTVSKIKSHIMGALSGFVKAQFKIMFIIFMILLIGLLVMGSPYAMLFALLIAIVDLLPIFGTGTIMIPWALMSLLNGDYRRMIFLVILYVICLVSRQLLQPKIIGDSVGLDTLPTLVLIYAGYKLAGMKGMILALLIGIVFITLYRTGIFDAKIARVNKLINDYYNYS